MIAIQRKFTKKMLSLDKHGFDDLKSRSSKYKIKSDLRLNQFKQNKYEIKCYSY